VPAPALAWKALTAAALAATVALVLFARRDREAPVLRVSPLPSGPTGGAALVVEGTVDDAHPVQVLVQVGAAPPRPAALGPGGAFRVQLPLDGLPDGPVRVEVEAVDEALDANRAAWAGELLRDATPPAVSLRAAALAPGRARALHLEADPDAVALEIELAGQAFPARLDPAGGWRALVAVRHDHAGPAALTVRARDAAGNAATWAGALEVAPAAWPEGGHIPLTAAQKAARKDEGALARAREARAAAAAQGPEAPTWAGPLARPCTGWFSSPFGKYRTYADGARSHHLGLDIAEVQGAPVGAAAPGTVTLVDEQPIFGKTVIVVHGLGVATSYNHLSATSVQVGQAVAAGERLGAVGTTGQSTGPHLHWTVSVGGVAVDPAPWLTADPLQAPVAGESVALTRAEGTG
jgi:murein DD-endopeptidase MepM/ murein hydrolase activator NlpD